MTDIEAAAPRLRGTTGAEGLSPDEMSYPTVEDLRKRARRRVPRFAYDFVAGGCADDHTVARNRAAFDAIQILPRYGLGMFPVSTRVELFGHSYAAPIGMSPIGLAGMFWPGIERHLAKAAQAANVPYVLATPACEAIETIAAIAPDVFWFQSYAVPAADFHITFDLLRRAARAGAKALLVTIDAPVRAKRPQDMRNRLAVPFKPSLATLFDMARRPHWLRELARRGTPRAENFVAYLRENATATEVSRFAGDNIRGGYTWETIRRLRDAWSGPLVIKGVLHPHDAELAVGVGANGILVSNHGGRTFDAAPASVEMLPHVKAVVGDMPLLLDSGVRSGLDIVRGLAAGAHFVLAGRPFLYGVGALGAKGGTHVLDLLIDETRGMMGQIGAHDVAAISGSRLWGTAAQNRSEPR